MGDDRREESRNIASVKSTGFSSKTSRIPGHREDFKTNVVLVKDLVAVSV